MLLLIWIPTLATVLAQETDPPVDRGSPASMHTVQIPSHGSLLNGFVYEAAGLSQHPAVLLLHGFPGNEKNLDLVRAGMSFISTTEDRGERRVRSRLLMPWKTRKRQWHGYAIP